MALFDEVTMTDSGNDSESGHSSSNGNGVSINTSNNNLTNNNNASSPSAFATLTAGGRLAKLLAREQELIKTLEELTREIEQLEQAPAEDEGAKAPTGAEEDGDDEGDDLEEFEAPEWCVPIKANVMTYDWDVSFLWAGPLGSPSSFLLGHGTLSWLSSDSKTFD